MGNAGSAEAQLEREADANETRLAARLGAEADGAALAAAVRAASPKLAQLLNSFVAIHIQEPAFALTLPPFADAGDFALRFLLEPLAARRVEAWASLGMEPVWLLRAAAAPLGSAGGHLALGEWLTADLLAFSARSEPGRTPMQNSACWVERRFPRVLLALEARLFAALALPGGAGALAGAVAARVAAAPLEGCALTAAQRCQLSLAFGGADAGLLPLLRNPPVAGSEWSRLFDSLRDGASLGTLLRCVTGYSAATLLVVELEGAREGQSTVKMMPGAFRRRPFWLLRSWCAWARC